MPTILIASQEDRARTRLLAAFQAAGWIVREAVTGARAVESAGSVDIVVIDSSFAIDGLANSTTPVLRAGDDPAQVVELANVVLRARRAEQDRDRATAKLDAVLSLMSEMYVEIDSDWRVTLANRAAVDYLAQLGRPADGRVFDILPELAGTEHARRVATVIRTGQRDKFEMPSLLSDRYLEVEMTPIPEGLAVSIRDITATKAAEDRYRASFELASIAKAQADVRSRRFVRVNSKMVELTGYSEAELLTKAVSEITHPDDRGADALYFDEVAAGKRTEYTAEKRYIRKTGETIWVKVHVGVVRDAKGTPVSTTAVIEDITESKRVNEQLLRAQHNLRRLAEANICGFATANVDQVLDANDEFLRILGRTRADLEEGRIDWEAATPPEHRASDRRGVEAILTTGVCEPFEKEFIRPDGTRIPVLIGATRITDDPVWLAFILDLSERKRADEEREASRRRMEQLFELGQVFIHDDASGILFWSSAAESMYGFSKSEALGRDPHELLQTRFPAGRQTTLDALREHGTWDGELFHTRRDGTEIVVASHWAVWHDDQGHPTTVEINNDVTQRVRAEERLRAAQMGAGLGVWDWNVRTGQMYWSSEYRALYDLGDEFVPTVENWLGLVDEADREWAAEAVRRSAGDGAPMDVEFRATRAGVSRWIRVIGDVSDWQAGQPVRMTGIAQDVTSRKTAQAELERANAALQRSNEELRQFAYGVSHDLQEPLRTVASFAQLLARNNAGRLDEQSAEFMQNILDATGRMNFMIRDLLKYSSAVHQAPAEDVVDLNRVVDWALGNLRQRIQESGAHVAIEPLPLVRGDFARLSQVMQNLIGNALKYRKADEPPRICVSSERTGAEWTVCVADNGIGFDPVYADSIFGVFRRLHGREISGTGIGLAVCRRIIEQHCGRIWADSKPGEGSRFYFTLPAID